jgi:hypothetical protein
MILAKASEQAVKKRLSYVFADFNIMLCLRGGISHFEQKKAFETSEFWSADYISSDYRKLKIPISKAG